MIKEKSERTVKSKTNLKFLFSSTFKTCSEADNIAELFFTSA